MNGPFLKTSLIHTVSMSWGQAECKSVDHPMAVVSAVGSGQWAVGEGLNNGG